MLFQKVCVVGLGYIGLPTASTFAANGMDVVGVDINKSIVSVLQNGGLHIYEPGLREVVDFAFQSGRLTVQEVPEKADAFIIAVPTPFYDDKKADLRFVVSAAESILPFLRRGNLVILESTSPPQTTTNILAPILEKSGLKAGVDFHLAYSPERVLPGNILRELVENARVIGGVDLASAEAGRDLYAAFVKGEIILTTSTTAEMVKLMENTYRDVNIAIANEFARLADRFGVDVWEAIEIANRHPRVKILKPGIGVGGHCISVDPWFLVEAASDITPLIHTARQVNDAQPHFVLNLIQRAVGDVVGKRVSVIGLAYKPEVDDVRESPAIESCYLLQKQGALVQCYEPYRGPGELMGLINAPDLDTVLVGADVLVLAVAHSSFLSLDPEQVAAYTPTRIVIDGVHGLNTLAWEQAGFQVHTLGINNKVVAEIVQPVL